MRIFLSLSEGFVLTFVVEPFFFHHPTSHELGLAVAFLLVVVYSITGTHHGAGKESAAWLTVPTLHELPIVFVLTFTYVFKCATIILLIFTRIDDSERTLLSLLNSLFCSVLFLRKHYDACSKSLNVVF